MKASAEAPGTREQVQDGQIADSSERCGCCRHAKNLAGPSDKNNPPRRVAGAQSSCV
jgi:hypothetical protein